MNVLSNFFAIKKN